MALVTCPDCGTQYDQSAAHCPNCGRPNPLRQPGASTGSETPRDTPPGATGGTYAGGTASGGAAGGASSAGGAYSGGAYAGGAPGQGGGFSGGGAAGAGGGAYAGGPAGGAQYGGGRPEIPNYLVFAIFVTLCCCVPLGIPALINAARVDARRDLGDFDGAWAASREAKKWAIIALVAGLAIYVISMLLQGAMMAAMAGLAETQGAGLEGM